MTKLVISQFHDIGAGRADRKTIRNISHIHNSRMSQLATQEAEQSFRNELFRILNSALQHKGNELCAFMVARH